MRKLIEKYKNMSPEMRMLFAAAGLGSFGTIVYTLDKWIFAGRRIMGVPSLVFTALGIALLMSILYGAGTLVSKGFGRRSKKRGEKMMEDMGGDLGRGPVSMDAREAVKENNKKFFEEIREMRKQTKLNVYDLPWYIVIGDSGCGKTRLIEHSGLTFSRGRPEGYQLGTLNYNWWFTEDAIFIDMAGRLCNPQEDADHKEWQGFLNTVAKGRPACPINGAIVCISAEHLLEDAPEKIEGDANTMLERLRDLQGKLGVTFATYVVVTKCDKILGFMQFFDRADRDVEVRNQMVGWTRPAPFTDLFDPESFHGEFEHLYQRLNELRVRRLNDDAEEEELGMAYCLPEEFRELRDPLHTYLRVLFPPIKNPRAIKNLVARGVYFTSSVQQGSVILKHLKERMGAEAGENIKPLEDLYGKAKQKPLFIKHLLIRKVFPEFGLVFRNANEVARNKKYSRLLYIWSGVLAATLFGLMFWGISHFKNLIGGPQAHAVAATVVSPADRKSDTVESVALASALGADVKAVEGGTGFRTWLAAPLVWNKREPIDHLKVVRAGLYQRDILPGIIRDAAAAFESKKPGKPKDYWPSAQACQDQDYVDYKNAVLAYSRWLRWAREAQSKNDRLNFDDGGVEDRKKDLVVLMAWGSAAPATTQPSDAAAAVDEYFALLGNMKDMLSGDEGWPHPALSAVAGGALTEERAQAAVNVVKDYFRTNYVALSDKHPNPIIREWISRNLACERYLNQYVDFLKLARRRDVTNAREFEELRKKEFAEEDSTLSALKKDFATATRAWQVRNEGGMLAPIRQFDDAIKRVRDESWVAFAGELREAIGSDSWANGVRVDLDKDLWTQLAEAKMLEDDDQPYSPEAVKDLPRHVADYVSQRASAVLTVAAPSEADKKDSPDAAPSVAVAESAAVVQGHLQEIQRDVMAISLGSGTSAALPPGQWVSKMIRLDEPPRAPNWNDIKEHEKVWRPAELNEVAKRANEWSHRAETTNLLFMAADALEGASKDEWGVYSLLTAKPESRGRAAMSDDEPDSDRSESRRNPLRYGRGEGGDRPVAELQARADWAGVTPRLLGRSIDETVLFSADIQCNVQRLVKYEFKPAGGEKAASSLCLERLAAGLTRYFTKYTDYWSQEYARAELTSIQGMLQARTLGDLQSKLRDDGREVASELRKKVGDVLEHICWSNQSRPVDSGNADFNAEATSAVSAMMRELDGLWSKNWRDDKHKRFVREATRGVDAADGKGYDGITTALVRGWDKLSENILEAKVGVVVQASGLSQAFMGARERNGLTDERLTEYVEQLAIHAANLINNQMREELCELQRQCLGSVAVADGLPYTSSGGVVDDRRFFEFLSAVEKMERTAAMGAGNKYAPFFDACRQWRDFLGMSSGSTTTFSITKADTPVNFVGIQNNYQSALLKFGGRDYKVPILERDVDPGAEFQWDWRNSSGNGELILSDLVPAPTIQGLPNLLRQPVGAGGGLNFCRLLRANSSGSGRSFTINVPIEGIPGGGKPKACTFRIELKGAGMPGPIPDPCRM